MSFGDRVNDGSMFPNLVFRDQGDGAAMIVGGLIDPKNHRDTCLSLYLDPGRSNGDLCRPGLGRIIANQVGMSPSIADDMCMLAQKWWSQHHCQKWHRWCH